MLPKHIVQAIDRAPHEVPKALRGFLRTVDFPDQMVVCHKINRICSVPFRQRLAMLKEAVIRDSLQAVVGDKVDHTRDPLGEVFFYNLQCRQLAVCPGKNRGLERALTPVDEEMYNASIRIAGAEEEDLRGIIATMKRQQTQAPKPYKA